MTSSSSSQLHIAPKSIFIGINGGGTKTTLVAVDSSLDVLAQVQTGGSNQNNFGVDQVRATLHTAIRDLLAQAGLTVTEIGGIGAGLAGVDRPNDRIVFAQIFDEILPGVPLVLENDGTIALVAGVGRKFGVIVISGTGTISIGADDAGTLARCSGWGWLIDDGSGYAIGREILRAICDARDGAQPPTLLTERVLARLNLENFDQLVPWIYAPNRNPNEIAALAAEAVAVVHQDLTALRILVRAADALARNAVTVINRLNFGDQKIPVVLSGGIFDHVALVRERFIQRLQTQIPNIQPTLATRGAELGAAILAIQHSNPAATFTRGSTPLPITERRGTELRNTLTMEISYRPTLELLTIMNIEDSRIHAAIAPNLPKMAELIDSIAPRFRQGGRLIGVGAGTSGRLAVLDAVECRPTFGASPDQVFGILAGGIDAMMHSIEGAEDDADAGAAQIDQLNVGELDTVIGVAASGSTPFVIGALRAAKARGATTASIVNVVDAPISAISDYPFIAATGAEVLTGSTRLRAGTAQKLMLNMISTGVMIRAGRTMNNLMTDMQARNLKLNHRAKVIVSEGAGVSIDEAGALLEKADGEIKTAIAAALLGVNIQEARLELEDIEGDLNRLNQ
jgi:N-acetylmuramic acid 6-phosphate etherase